MLIECLVGAIAVGGWITVLDRLIGQLVASSIYLYCGEIIGLVRWPGDGIAFWRGGDRRRGPAIEACRHLQSGTLGRRPAGGVSAAH